jgi:hypothetical protein
MRQEQVPQKDWTVGASVVSCAVKLGWAASSTMAAARGIREDRMVKMLTHASSVRGAVDMM